jgi:hypothetical protein
MTDIVQQTYQDIVNAGYLEDRMEYTIDDLQLAYPNLTAVEIMQLYDLIQNAE